MRVIVHPRFLPNTAGVLARGLGEWVRVRYTGDGVGQPRVPSSASVSLYAWKQEDIKQPTAAGGSQVTNNGWWVGSHDPTVDIMGEDVITSVADSDLSLIIIGPADDQLPGVTLWRANQQ